MSSAAKPRPDHVVIGMDPHKRSATIEVTTADETGADGGRFGTDRDGNTAMLRYDGQWPERVWAIEGCAGDRQAPREPAPGRRCLRLPRRLRRGGEDAGSGRAPLVRARPPPGR